MDSAPAERSAVAAHSVRWAAEAAVGQADSVRNWCAGLAFGLAESDAVAAVAARASNFASYS